MVHNRVTTLMDNMDIMGIGTTIVVTNTTTTTSAVRLTTIVATTTGGKEAIVRNDVTTTTAAIIRTMIAAIHDFNVVRGDAVNLTTSFHVSS